MEENNLLSTLKRAVNLVMPEPLNYVSFMNVVFNCRFVLTDSGGIQEETSYLGIPCLTLRKNTERPVTITHGTNQLCELDDLRDKLGKILDSPPKERKTIELWDGKTAGRIVDVIRRQRASSEACEATIEKR
jgi:UDP-N-acetylglucosamine 2-epimerase (non-hydrolysing)